MSRATLLLLGGLLATAGCGRFAFDPLTPGGDDDDGDGGIGDGQGDSGAPPGWWDGGWHNRMKIDLGDPGEALLDVPLLVELDPSRFDYSTAASDGRDLRFIDADGATVLAYEIERWNANAVSDVWVRVPQIDVGTTGFIWLYWGNPGAAAAANAGGTWAGYALTWHLDEDPSATAPQINDSTVNSNAGTTTGGIPANAQTAGKIGGAIAFDGTDDFITGPGSASLRSIGDITISMWVFRQAAARREWLCDFSTPSSEQEGNNHLYELTFDASNNISLEWEYNAGSDEGIQSSVPLASPINQWTFISVTRAVGTNEVRFYENGALLGTPVTYTNDPTGGTTGSFWFAGMVDPSSTKLPFQGRIDEVRVEARSRSPGWIATQYRSMSDTYLTFGPVERY